MKAFKDLLSGENRQWLMGFAILWVMAFHFCMYGNLLRFAPLNFLFGKGYLGVDIFLLLSSYGLCWSYSRRSLKDYYVQRVKRLYPVYLFFVVALVLLNADHNPLTGLLQITGLSNFFGLELEWYVPALIVIYALFPLIFKGVSWLYKRGILWVLALVLLLTLVAPLLSHWVFYLFVIRFPLIVLGIALYLAVNEDNERKMMAVLVFAAALGFCVSGREMLNGSQTGMLMLPLVLYGLAQLQMRLPLGGIVRFCGRHSLEIYLAQNLALNQFYANSDMPFLVKTAVAVGVIVMGSVLLWACQEGFWKGLKRK